MPNGPSKDRASLCTFTFSDGRQCNLPQSADDMGLCYVHAQKFISRMKAEAAGREISEFLNTDILTACELNSAFATLFSATAQGLIKPKTAATLAYLGQLMLQTHRLAKEEFLDAFEGGWDEVTQKARSFNLPDPAPPAGELAPLTPVPSAASDSDEPDAAEPEPFPSSDSTDSSEQAQSTTAQA